MTFTKQNLGKIRQELNAVLAKYGVEGGFDFEIGNIKFTDTEFTTKLTCRVRGATPRKEAISSDSLALYMAIDGIKNIISKCGKYKLVGYETRRYRMPYSLVEISTGKNLKAANSYVKAVFG